jgi:hypothetical protein
VGEEGPCGGGAGDCVRGCVGWGLVLCRGCQVGGGDAGNLVEGRVKGKLRDWVCFVSKGRYDILGRRLVLILECIALFVT